MATGINQRIADTVRALLAERRITHEAFYLATGMPERTGARRLAGTSVWSIDELHAAATYLDVPLSELISAGAVA